MWGGGTQEHIHGIDNCSTQSRLLTIVCMYYVVSSQVQYEKVSSIILSDYLLSLYVYPTIIYKKVSNIAIYSLS